MNEMRPAARMEAFTTTRVTTLVDGVFAIVLTLLVLDLHAPVASNRDALIAALRAIAPQIKSFLVSFIVLGVFWYGHHMEMHWIERSDRVHLGITLAFLLTISFVPFSASLLGNNQQIPLAAAIYALNLFAVGVARYAHWVYATSGFRLSVQEQPLGQVRFVRRMFMVVPLLFIAAGALAWLNTGAAMVTFVLIPLVYLIPSPQTRHLTLLPRSEWTR
jgi:uncharacterized membrane protein